MTETTPANAGRDSVILQIDQACKSFGGLMAVNYCSFEIPTGLIAGLIGPNGAGKTTLFNLIAGVLTPDSGAIRYQGHKINDLSPDQIARRGLVRTFQIPRLFPRMTVWENLMLAAPRQTGENALRALIPRIWRSREAELSAQAQQTLAFVDLSRLSNEYAGNLSGGQRKLLDLARVLMMNPHLILLDEPMAGVNPSLARTLIERIERLNQEGITFLVVEHDIDMIMKLCQKIVVMHYGRRLAEGDPETIRRHPKVLEAYLGGAV